MERLETKDHLNISIERQSDTKKSQDSIDSKYRRMYKSVTIKDMVNARRAFQFEGTVPNY
jgi:hypothetical protein